MIPSFDLLGLSHEKWPIHKTLELLPPGCMIGYFHDLFGGRGDEHINLLLDSGKVSAIRVHFYFEWPSGHHICPLQKVMRLATHYQSKKQKYPGVKFYLSHTCEYAFALPYDVSSRVNVIRKLAPSCTPVNSPYKGSPTMNGVITELHGYAAIGGKGTGVSLDGSDAFTIPVKAWLGDNAQAEYAFSWFAGCNLWQHEVPPTQRTQIPTEDQLKSFFVLSTAATF